MTLTRRLLPMAFAALLAAPATADIADMTEAEREAFREEVRAYLLDNPEVLIEAMDVLESRERVAQADTDRQMARANLTEIQDDGYSWVGGNPDGDVTLVEFMDYRCGYCRQAFAEVEELVASDGDIRFVLKEFPILGEQSTLAARFAIAVQQLHGDDVYKDVHDALMTMRTDVTEETLTRLAEGYELEPAPLLERMNDDAVTEVIAANHALARQLQITGTPTFVVEDRMLRGYLPLPQMEQVVATVRSE